VTEVADPSGASGRRSIDLRVQPALRRRFSDPTTRTELFGGMPHTTGAGVAACLSARRPDGRLVVWTVEAWLDTWDEDAESPWTAVVKGEIEADVPSGDPDTVFDVQRTVHDVPATIAAVRECAALVAAYDVPRGAGMPPDESDVALL
jgi:hypothetical protein